MSAIFRALLRLRTAGERRAFTAACRDPAAAQTRVLRDLLARSAGSAFAAEHGLHAVRTPADFAAAVPIRDYDGLSPWIRRSLAGEPRVLGHDPVESFVTTSGTAGEPKFVPVTRRFRERMEGLTRIWTAQLVADHPEAFARSVLTIASPAVEGHTERGVPHGSMSGLIQGRLPWIVRRRRALPPEIDTVADAEDRYFLIARHAYARAVSLVAAPNPATLMRLCEIGSARAEAIVAAIRDGEPGIARPRFRAGVDAARAWASLRAHARPDRVRAAFLARCLAVRGTLLPRDVWPELRVIACWLGGSMGIAARRLADGFGAVPRRDPGLLASEGRISIPIADETAEGVLALTGTYFELVPVEADGRACGDPIGVAEARLGGRYRPILTGSNGLWRYDIQDIVEVTGFLDRAPRVTFLRKGRDYLSITGEKVHVNQVQRAIGEAERETGITVAQYRLVGDAERACHELLAEAVGGAPLGEAARRFLAAYDRELSRLNPEYESRRSSRRLQPPALVAMRPGWAERRARDEFAAGKREQQYKWRAIVDGWDEGDRAEVLERFELS